MNDKQTLKYKSFEGSIEVSIEDKCLYGEILFIRDTVLYSANDIDGIKVAFEEAVEQYLTDCAELNKEPNKPFSGSFNVRVGACRHQSLASYSYRKGVSINSVICDGIDLFFEVLSGKTQESIYVAATTQVRLDDSSNWRPVLRAVK